VRGEGAILRLHDERILDDAKGGRTRSTSRAVLGGSREIGCAREPPERFSSAPERSDAREPADSRPARAASTTAYADRLRRK
jgi:hypothetical protein